MTPEKLDDLALLAAANPVHAREPLDDAERAGANALLERIVAESSAEPSRRAEPRRPRRRRRLTLAGAGALALAAIVAVLVFPGAPGGKSADAVAQAVAALSGREGVFHVVAQTTTGTPGAASTRTWTETWASADDSRSRSLIFDVTPAGGRGRLLAERVGNTTVIWNSPRHGDGPYSDAGRAAVRPRSFVLALLRSGRVTRRAAVTTAGRPAWRFEIVDRVDDTSIVAYGHRTAVPAYTTRTVLVVDRRTHLPLSVRTSGVVPAVAGPPSGRVTYPRQTTNARFSRFDRLTDADGAVGLRPSRRFRRR